MSLSSLSSIALTFLILLIVHHCTSDSTASEALSEIQQFSELINDNFGQSKNNTSEKEDQEMDKDEQQEFQESTDILDPDWMAEWRKKMEVYAKWLDHFSNAYPMGGPRTFARTSRGRIDRMPLSYGKRSVRSGAIKDVTDSGDADAVVRQHRISPNAGEERDVRSEADVSEVTDPHTRTLRGRLSRMPITFGKRAIKEEIERNHFTRLPKGRVDRMPLTFGKRGGSVFLANAFDNGQYTRIPKDRLGRMPLTFGKRNEKDLKDSDADVEEFTNLILGGLSRTASNYEKGITDDTADTDDYYSRIVRGRLDRMPAMFGKRQHDKILNNAEDTSYFSRLPKSRINRMPAMFGKRQDGEMLVNSEDSGIFSRTAKSRIDRMPAMFGKRQDEEVLNNSEERNVFSRTAKGSIDRMPAMFGKRRSGEVLGYSEESSLFSRTPKGRLDRMPLTFGKREEHESLVYNNEDNFFERMAKGSLARMPLSFGKRSRTVYERVIDTLRAKLSTLPPDRRDELNEKLSKFLDNLMVEHTPLTRLQRSRLERMPLTFGKRSRSLITLSGLPSESNDFSDKFADVDPLRSAFSWNTEKRLKVDRMPISFGKRSSTEGRSFEDVILRSEHASKESLNSKTANTDSDTHKNSHDSATDADSDVISSILMR